MRIIDNINSSKDLNRISKSDESQAISIIGAVIGDVIGSICEWRQL